MGRSGSGKGKQGELLKAELAKDGRSVFYLETGAKFRQFVASGSYSGQLASQALNQGALLPSFLAVWNWGSSLLDKLTGEEHLIIDGTPRMLAEAEMFDGALKFYQRTPATFIYLNTSAAEAVKRLTLRGRSDDVTPEKINTRMQWFEQEVMPVIEHYRTSPLVKFVEINGDQSVEVVQAEIMTKLADYLHD